MGKYVSIGGCTAPVRCGLLQTWISTQPAPPRISADSAILSLLGRDGDIGVEHYQQRDGTPLTMVCPSIVENFDDPAMVERAWIAVCDFAGQRLAHLTDDNKLNNSDVTPMLRRAFETIPELVSRTFFDRVG